jgi:hypothetical protein
MAMEIDSSNKAQGIFLGASQRQTQYEKYLEKEKYI